MVYDLEKRNLVRKFVLCCLKIVMKDKNTKRYQWTWENKSLKAFLWV